MITNKTGKTLLLSALLLSGCLIVLQAQQSRNKTLSPSKPTDSWPISLQPDESAVYNISIVDSPSYEFVESSSFTNFNNPDFVWSGSGGNRSFSFSIMNTGWKAGVAVAHVDCAWRPVGGSGSGSGPPPSWKYGWAHGTATALPADFVVEARQPVPAIAPIGGTCELRSALKKNDWEKRHVNANWSIASPAYFQGTYQNVSLVQATSDQAGAYYASATCVDCGRSAGATTKFVAVDYLEYHLGNYNWSTPPAPIYTPVGSNLYFRAIPDPTPDWPSGKPVWGGAASGTGTDQVSVFFPEPGSNDITAECGNTVTSTVVAFSADFTVESDDPHHSGMILTDNREATVTISVEGVSDPSALSFQLAANPVETGNLINNGGTSISFTPTENPLVWRTSKIYWYGMLPDNCCWTNRYEYNFALTVNGTHTVSNQYAMDWPKENPEMNGTVHWPSTTVIHDPELVPGYTNWYRCLIEFGDFNKSTEITGLPSTCQYAEEIAIEENYHAQQWMGEVHVNQGGQGDCFTDKSIKWWIGWVGEGPWYTYGNTPGGALADALDRVSTGQDEEWNKSKEITNADHGFVELKAKEYANYNAAFKYHCTYEHIYGPNPINHHHPAH